MRHSCIFVGLLLFVLTALSATGAETLDHELVPSNLGEADFVESSRLVLVNNERDECSSDANQRTNGPQVRRRGKACVPRKTPIRGSKFHENGATNRPNSGTSPDSQKENPAFPFDEFDNYELCPIDRYGLINSIPVCDSGVLKDRAYQPDGSWRLFHATLFKLEHGCFSPRKPWCCGIFERTSKPSGSYSAYFCQPIDSRRPVYNNPWAPPKSPR